MTFPNTHDRITLSKHTLPVQQFQDSSIPDLPQEAEVGTTESNRNKPAEARFSLRFLPAAADCSSPLILKAAPRLTRIHTGHSADPLHDATLASNFPLVHHLSAQVLSHTEGGDLMKHLEVTPACSHLTDT